MITTMTSPEQKLLSQDILKAEKSLNLKFPNSYKEFLLKYNGGTPDECAIDFDAAKLKVQGEDIKYFYSIGGKKTNDVVHKSLSKDYTLPDGVIFLANTHSSNFFLLSLRDDSYGQLFYKDHEFEDTIPFEPNKNILPESMVKVADSFDEFISMLYDPDDV